MTDYLALIGLILFLIVYLYIDKKSFKEFYDKSMFGQFNILRLPILIIAIIICVIIKILNS